MGDGVWRTIADLDADVMHVVRETAAAHHTTTPDCPCCPELQLRERDDGSVGTLFIHLDVSGRP